MVKAIEQPQVRLFNQYIQDRWSVKDGLLQVVAASIVQDDEGYLWIGSQVGLSRFDGIKFTHFTPANTPELSSMTTKLLSDSSGRLWIGTEKGLILRKNGVFLSIPFGESAEQASFPAVYVHNILELDSGDILVSAQSGMYIVEDQTLRKFIAGNIGEDTFKKPMFGLLQTQKNIWLGGLGELFLYSDGKLNRYAFEENNSSLKIEHIVSYRGKLLLGTTKGLYYLSNKQLVPFLPESKLSITPIDAMLVDSNQELWVGTNLGLFHFNDGQLVEHISNDNPEAFKVIRSIFQDKENNLWLGSYIHGIARLRPTTAYTFGAQLGLTEPLVWSVLPDANKLWVGTNNGLNQFENGRFSLVVAGSQLPHPVVYSMYASLNEVILGTRAGVAIFDKNTQTIDIPKALESLKESEIRSIVPDEGNGIYLGTNNGLYHYVNGKTNWFSQLDSGEKVSIRYIKKTSDGRTLLGGERGIYEFNNNTIKKIYPLNKDEVFHITYIYEDHDGSFLYGTATNGLIYQKGDTWFELSEKNSGLPTPSGFYIGKDSTNYVWVSSFNGMYRFAYKNIALFIQNKISSLETQHILSDTGKAFGAEKSDCCTGAGSAKGFMDKNIIMLPSRTGLITVDTQNINFNSIPPSQVIERINFNDEWHLVERSKILRLSKGARDLVFEFTAPSFQDPQSVMIKYQLVGYDHDWKNLEDVTNRQATYTNLPAGDYQFQIKAANNSKVWNDQPEVLKFTIDSYFYETWWFYLIAISIFLLSIRYWHQRRIVFYQKQQAILEKEVEKQTQELRVANEKLVSISYTDPLTGLKNRRYLHEQIGKDIAYFKRLKESPDNSGATIVLMMVDIDHFKIINDTYGHGVGDKVITKLSSLLLSELREEDYIVRWGGEEFLIVSRTADRSDCNNIARRLCQRIATTSFRDELNNDSKITCSVGLALLPFFEHNPGSLTWENVVDIADKALYLVKQNGRNGWASFRASSKEEIVSIKTCNSFEEFKIANKLTLEKSW